MSKANDGQHITVNKALQLLLAFFWLPFRQFSKKLSKTSSSECRACLSGHNTVERWRSNQANSAATHQREG